MSTFTTGRKEKRWEVCTLLYVPVQEDDPTNSDSMVKRNVSNPAWQIILETSSFIKAKEKALELIATLGYTRVKITRVVDLSVVLYPVS